MANITINLSTDALDAAIWLFIEYQDNWQLNLDASPILVDSLWEMIRTVRLADKRGLVNLEKDFKLCGGYLRWIFDHEKDFHNILMHGDA